MKEFINNNQIYLIDLNKNKWHVVEVSDLEVWENELLEQRDELLKALKILLDVCDLEDEHGRICVKTPEKELAKQAINKAINKALK